MSPSRSWRDVLEVEARAPPLPCEFDGCCPSQNWTYRDQDMGEPCLPFGVFFFFPWLILIRFDANCFNFQKYTVQIHVSRRTSSCMKRKKGFLVKKTLAHICFLFISLPMTWDLMHRYTSWFLQRDEERKPPQRIVSVKKNQISYEEIITYFVLQKVKLSKGQQRKKHMTILPQT